MKKETFDNIISLGFNCQTAFAIKAFYYGDKMPPSNFFNWVFCYKVSAIADFLKNPQILFQSNLELSFDTFMYKDEHANFSYHTTVRPHDKFYKDGEPDTEFIENDKKDVISRMSHLRDKFFDSIKSDSKNLFILTYPSYDTPEQTVENITNISTLIKDLSGNKDSKLLVALEKKYAKKLNLPQLDNVIFKFTRKHAHPSFANRLHFFSWYKIFKSFKINNMPSPSLINLCKYMHSQKITFFDKILGR